MKELARDNKGDGFRGSYLYDAIRRVGTAFLTPVQFSRRTGHFRSSIARKAVDSEGHCIPWYTYPAIDFLSTIDFSEQSVLEFGAGHSTVWWSQRARVVLSIEDDSKWFEFLTPILSSQQNVDLVLCQDPLQYVNRPVGGKFDLIVIDGGPRNLCAERSLDCLNEGGAIVLDDSEGFWGGESDHSYPIVDLYSSRGFMRVDFYGYAPGVIKPRCTSVFTREGAKLFRGLPPPVKKY
jgi:hypothetical protein